MILLLSALLGQAQATCPATHTDVVASAEAALAAYGREEVQDFAAARRRMMWQVDCLVSVLEEEEIRLLHLVESLDRWLRADEAGTKAALSSLLRVDPGTDVAAATGVRDRDLELLVLQVERRQVETGDIPSPFVPFGVWRVDARTSPERFPTGTPVFLQLIDERTGQIESWYLGQGGAPPDDARFQVIDTGSGTDRVNEEREKALIRQLLDERSSMATRELARQRDEVQRQAAREWELTQQTLALEGEHGEAVLTSYIRRYGQVTLSWLGKAQDVEVPQVTLAQEQLRAIRASSGETGAVQAGIIEVLELESYIERGVLRVIVSTNVPTVAFLEVGALSSFGPTRLSRDHDIEARLTPPVIALRRPVRFQLVLVDERGRETVYGPEKVSF